MKTEEVTLLGGPKDGEIVLERVEVHAIIYDEVCGGGVRREHLYKRVRETSKFWYSGFKEIRGTYG